jgi:hypothetical protein
MDPIRKRINDLKRSLRKVMPPPGQTHRDRTKVLPRKAKHKGKGNE